MTRGAAVALAALALAGCESTQAKSARLAKQEGGGAEARATRLGGPNPDVRVVQTTVLRGRDGIAVAVVELRNLSARPQARVPVLIQVKDRRGRPLYANDVEGLQPSLQEMALIEPHGRAFWVNDQVTASAGAVSVITRVGRPRAPARAGGERVSIERVRLERDSSGSYVSGELRNRSRVAQVDVPVYLVARRAGRIVAAGRAIVPSLAPGRAGAPAPFQIYFAGDSRGARLSLAALPTVLGG